MIKQPEPANRLNELYVFENFRGATHGAVKAAKEAFESEHGINHSSLAARPVHQNLGSNRLYVFVMAPGVEAEAESEDAAVEDTESDPAAEEEPSE